MVADYQERQLGNFLHHKTTFAGLRRIDTLLLLRDSPLRVRAKGLRNAGQERLFLKISHDHEKGIVGVIVGLVVGLHILQGQMRQIVPPANGGPVIRRGLKGDGVQLFCERGRRIVLGPQPSFLHHYEMLRVKVLLLQHEVLHPIRLQLHGHLHLGCVEILEIGRKVTRGEGVVITPVLPDTS